MNETKRIDGEIVDLHNALQEWKDAGGRTEDVVASIISMIDARTAAIIAAIEASKPSSDNP